jgi:hypothetical protein
MLNQKQIMELLWSKRKEEPLLESLEERERLANSILDIIESVQIISALVSTVDEFTKEDSLHNLKMEISHISYHILDSIVLRQGLKFQIEANFENGDVRVQS